MKSAKTRILYLGNIGKVRREVTRRSHQSLRRGLNNENLRGGRIVRLDRESIFVGASPPTGTSSGDTGKCRFMSRFTECAYHPPFGPRKDGLKQIGTIDIKPSRLTVCALAVSAPGTMKWHSRPLRNLPISARKCHFFAMDTNGPDSMS